MQLIYLESIPSTQTYLIEKLQCKMLRAPVCVYTGHQSRGIGSRGDSWQMVKDGLYFSFALSKKDLPSDLKLESASIYFGVLVKQSLQNLGSKVWLKWPNDLYLDTKKIGGIMCSVKQETIICGVGINIGLESTATLKPCPLTQPSEKYSYKMGALEPCIARKFDKEKFLQYFIFLLKKNISWKQIFRIYKLEFSNNFSYTFHIDNELKSFKDSVLLDDGSICIDGKIVYSCR